MADELGQRRRIYSSKQLEDFTEDKVSGARVKEVKKGEDSPKEKSGSRESELRNCSPWRDHWDLTTVHVPLLCNHALPL